MELVQMLLNPSKNVQKCLRVLLLLLLLLFLSSFHHAAPPDFLNQIDVPHHQSSLFLGMGQERAAQLFGTEHGPYSQFNFLNDRVVYVSGNISFSFVIQGVQYGSTYEEMVAAFGEPQNQYAVNTICTAYLYFFDRQGYRVNDLQEQYYCLQFDFHQNRISNYFAAIVLNLPETSLFTVENLESGLRLTLGGESAPVDAALDPALADQPSRGWWFFNGEPGVRYERKGGRITCFWVDFNLWKPTAPAMAEMVSLSTVAEAFGLKEKDLQPIWGGKRLPFNLDANGELCSYSEAFVHCDFYLDGNEYSFEGVTFRKGYVSFALYYSDRFETIG